jgi:hypothetical protein
VKSKRAGPDSFQVFGPEFVNFLFSASDISEKLISGPKFIKIKDY